MDGFRVVGVEDSGVIVSFFDNLDGTPIRRTFHLRADEATKLGISLIAASANLTTNQDV